MQCPPKRTSSHTSQRALRPPDTMTDEAVSLKPPRTRLGTCCRVVNERPWKFSCSKKVTWANARPTISAATAVSATLNTGFIDSSCGGERPEAMQCACGSQFVGEHSARCLHRLCAPAHDANAG